MPIRERPWMCLMCGYQMDAYSLAIGEAEPVARDGDVSMCLNCGLAYTRHGAAWRPMTKAERTTLEADDPEAAKLLNAMARLRPMVITKDLAADRGGRA